MADVAADILQRFFIDHHQLNWRTQFQLQTREADRPRKLTPQVCKQISGGKFSGFWPDVFTMT